MIVCEHAERQCQHLHSGNLTNTLEGHIDYVYSVAFDPSGGTLASGSYDHTVKLWVA